MFRNYLRRMMAPASFALGMLFVVGVSVNLSQTCRNPDSASLRHYPQGNPTPSYPNDGQVIYYFENIPAGPQRSQIISAINNWNSALSSGCSNIQFVAGAPSGDHAPHLAIKNATIGNGVAATSEETVYSGNEITVGTIIFDPNLRIGGILFYDPNVGGYSTVYTKQAMHEIGHLLGLSHYRTGHPNACIDQSRESSAMNDACGVNDNGTYFGPTFYPNNQTTNVTGCDSPRLSGIYVCPTPTPTPTPTPEVYECDPTGYEQDWCENVECNEWDPVDCVCRRGPPGECGSPQAGPCCSPIVIDISGDGYDLTNAANGVLFDLNGDGTISSRLAWTSNSSDDAWLALDRNGNGLIEKGAELFGNFTDQPASTQRNGFAALAVFDEPQNGGNGNGRINAQDAVFAQLRLWQDLNHNGVSEMNELHPLPTLGVAAIDLDYRQSRRRDQHGNRFRYRAKVRDTQGAHVGRWAWDVFLRSESLDESRSLFIQEQRTLSFVKQGCGG